MVVVVIPTVVKQTSHGITLVYYNFLRVQLSGVWYVTGSLWITSCRDTIYMTTWLS